MKAVRVLIRPSVVGVSVLTVSAWLLVLSATARGASPQAPQGRGAPPPPQNLQVLPKDIPRPQLLMTMQLWAQALGVQCTHCHVTEPTRDFASDAKPAKKTARVMLEMLNHANETLAAGIGKPAADVVKAQCWTCHRGEITPAQPPPLPPPAAAPAPGH